MRLQKKFFDEVPPAIRVEVAVDLLLPARFGRDHRYRASLAKFGTQPVSVKRLISKEHAEFHVVDKRFHSNEIMALTRQQNKSCQVSKRIHQRYDLGGQTAA